MKTYVITISQKFPATHPRKGELTNFYEQIFNGVKKHTIRGNYAFWKKRVDEINAGRAILSVRAWSGKPYASKQVELFDFTSLGIQKVHIYKVAASIEPDYSHIEIFIEQSIERLDNDKMIRLIYNDGLCLNDFRAWFKKPVEDGCIIHFTDLKY